jgi:hypothetical protein
VAALTPLASLLAFRTGPVLAVHVLDLDSGRWNRVGPGLIAQWSLDGRWRARSGIPVRFLGDGELAVETEGRGGVGSGSTWQDGAVYLRRTCLVTISADKRLAHGAWSTEARRLCEADGKPARWFMRRGPDISKMARSSLSVAEVARP